MKPIELVTVVSLEQAVTAPLPSCRLAHASDRPHDDPRYLTPLSAAPIVAAFASLSEAGASSATLMNAIGPRGLFSSEGTENPIASLLRELGVSGGEPVIRSISSMPDRAVAPACAPKLAPSRRLPIWPPPSVIWLRRLPLPNSAVWIDASSPTTSDTSGAPRNP